MNRILFEHDEIANGMAVVDDVRAQHIINVLHGTPGQILKTGEVNGLAGTGFIESIEEGRVTLRLSHTEESLRPWADLVLAPPRPRILKRLLPQLAAMGVGRMYLVGAKKVEKDFWGATLLKEETYRPLLVDGMMQAGTTILPTLHVRRNLRRFLNEELDALFPSSRRIIAHPYGAEAFAGGYDAQGASTLLAVGPEGGWTDEEVALFEAHAFRRYSLGPRILRTDTALVALLARLA